MYFAIEIIGYGKNRKYCIKKVNPNDNVIYPVNGRAYRTLDAAQRAAKELGVDIERIGDCWEII